MNEIAVLEVAREAVFVVLVTAGPLMAVGMLIGLIIALFQALTTIQEMTLTFVPKILVIFVAMVALLPFMMTTVVEFGRSLFDRIAAIG
ncbi:MAG: flagellar biosynthesis protein FliQ [Rhodospirillales bacterium]